MKEFRILSATAILGYGFPMQSFLKGISLKPHLIAVDGGSTDPGPYYLGEGVSFTDRSAVKRDLSIMIEAATENKIPVVIGTAGGSGARSHVGWCKEIIDEIVKEKDLHFQMAVIQSEFEKPFLKEALKNGKISALAPAPALCEQDLDNATSIVGQMGTEPIAKAIEQGADVVLCGRAYDPAVFAAPAIAKGFDVGLATHLGKILECAAIAAIPGSGSDCMFGTVFEDYFTIHPLNEERKCTTLSVAAHTLYEKTDPYHLVGPGGALDLTETKFEQFNGNTVKVSGSKFVEAEEYTVKLEGAACIGYRTVSIAGARDPIFIRQIDSIIKGVKERVKDNFSSENYEYYLNFNIYGKNGVMGKLEPCTESNPHEVGIIIEAVADTQEKADTICSFARSTLLHFGFPGRLATAGNLAFPYSPSDFKTGRVYEFCVYHILKTDPLSPFPIELVTY